MIFYVIISRNKWEIIKSINSWLSVIYFLLKNQFMVQSLWILFLEIVKKKWSHEYILKLYKNIYFSFFWIFYDDALSLESFSQIVSSPLSFSFSVSLSVISKSSEVITSSLLSQLTPRQFLQYSERLSPFFTQPQFFEQPRLHEQLIICRMSFGKSWSSLFIFNGYSCPSLVSHPQSVAKIPISGFVHFIIWYHTVRVCCSAADSVGGKEANTKDLFLILSLYCKYLTSFNVIFLLELFFLLVYKYMINSLPMLTKRSLIAVFLKNSESSVNKDGSLLFKKGQKFWF